MRTTLRARIFAPLFALVLAGATLAGTAQAMPATRSGAAVDTLVAERAADDLPVLRVGSWYAGGKHWHGRDQRRDYRIERRDDRRDWRDDRRADRRDWRHDYRADRRDWRRSYRDAYRDYRRDRRDHAPWVYRY